MLLACAMAVYGSTPGSASPPAAMARGNLPRVAALAAAAVLIGCAVLYSADGHISSTEKRARVSAEKDVSAKMSTLVKVGKDYFQKAPPGKFRFTKPSNPKLTIDLDPDADPSVQADFEMASSKFMAGVKHHGCHKISMNDGNPTIGETKTPTMQMSNLKVTKAFPGGSSSKMMLFSNQYCDIPRGDMPAVDAHGHDGSACYRAEWTLANQCRADYIPVRGELWFGFSVYIPAKVGKGMKDDVKFLETFPGQEKITKATFKKAPGAKSGQFDTAAFNTEQSNWLDLFQIHHGGYGEKVAGNAGGVRGLEGREPLIALTLMNGEYYTLMLSGSDEKTGTTTTIERIVNANMGQWEYFVYHTVMSPDKKVGVAQLWRNGEMIADRKGISTQYHTDDNPPFPKFGVYADSWKYHRHAYANTDLSAGFGKFKMGGASASYADVCIDKCGAGSKATPTPVAKAPAAAAAPAAPAATAAPAKAAPAMATTAKPVAAAAKPAAVAAKPPPTAMTAKPAAAAAAAAPAQAHVQTADEIIAEAMGYGK